jgi:hypothetical protein
MCTQHVNSHGPCIRPCPTHLAETLHFVISSTKCRLHQVLPRPPTTPLNFAHLLDPRNQNPPSQATHPPWPETLPKRSHRYHPNAPLSARSNLRILLFETNRSPRNSDVVRANLSLTGFIENLEGRGERAAHLMSRTPESPMVTVAYQGISDGLVFLRVPGNP